MATINSVANGNWNAGGTWSGGIVPGAGDTVNITHTVTYDANDDTNAINTINVNTGGTLQWAGGVGTKALRISTLLNQNGGRIIGRDGTQIRIHEGGSWTVQNKAGSNLDMKGTEPNASTTLSADTTTGNGYIDVTDGTNFNGEDWISVYDYANIAYSDRTDEVFKIHAKSANRLFIRRMVGPNFTLSQTINIGSNAFYCTADVRAWTSGMKFIIDTEIFTVSSNDSVNNIIYTVENAIVQHLSGVSGYETGVELEHLSGDKVYKLAATLIAEASAGNNYIDVSSAGGWSNNDELAIGGCWYTYVENKIIQSISVGGGIGGSDRIIFTTNLTYNHYIEGLVVKLNRDCVFIGSATGVTASNNAYIYIIYGQNARTISVENMDMQYVGNTGSALYGGFINRNYYGVTSDKILNCSIRHAYKSGNNGMMCSYSGYYHVYKNNVAFDSQNGIGTYSSSYYCYLTGNIIMKVNSVSMVFRSYYTEEAGYNLLEGNAGWGLYFIDLLIGYPDVKYNGLRNVARGWKYWYLNYCYSAILLYNNHMDNLFLSKFLVRNNYYVRFTYLDAYQSGSYLDKVMTDGSWETANSTDSASAYNRSDSYSFMSQVVLLTNYNFIPGEFVLRYYYGWCKPDRSVKISSKFSFIFTPKSNSVSSFIGFFAVIKAEVGKTIRVRAMVRKSSSFNGTGPIIILRDLNFDSIIQSSISVGADAWEQISVEHTIVKDENIHVFLGGYGSIGNFWIDLPQIDSDGCVLITKHFENFWQKKNLSSNTYGLLLNGAKLNG